MPGIQNASLRHAAYYVQLLYQHNQGYLRGGEEQASSLRQFEIELPNLRSIRENIPGLLDPLDKKHELSQMDQAFLEVSNTIPDAGAYLINVKLSARERIKWLEDALRASQRLQVDVTTQAHMGNLGLAHYELGELPEAIEYFQQALQSAEKIGDKYHQGAWLGNLGNIYSLLGEHVKAIEYHKRHLELMREIKDKRGEGHALANLGVSYAFLGQLPQAIENYKEHLSLARQQGDRYEESRALMNLGFAQYDAGDFDASSDYLNSAKQIATELGDKITWSLVMGGFADIAIERNEYAAAIQLLQEALKVFRDIHGIEAKLRLIQSLGNAYSASDDIDTAMQTYCQLYDLAQSVGAKAAMCSALANQTSLYRHMGDYPSAIKTGEQALSLARQIQSQSDEAFVRWQFALIDEANGMLEKAMRDMEVVIEMEKQLGSLVVERHREHLSHLIRQMS